MNDPYYCVHCKEVTTTENPSISLLDTKKGKKALERATCGKCGFVKTKFVSKSLAGNGIENLEQNLAPEILENLPPPKKVIYSIRPVKPNRNILK
jgi:hypothetical protein